MLHVRFHCENKDYRKVIVLSPIKFHLQTQTTNSSFDGGRRCKERRHTERSYVLSDCLRSVACRHWKVIDDCAIHFAGNCLFIMRGLCCGDLFFVCKITNIFHFPLKMVYVVKVTRRRQYIRTPIRFRLINKTRYRGW